MYFQFQPELVLVSAGYDSAIGCPEVLLMHLNFVCVCACVSEGVWPGVCACVWPGCAHAIVYVCACVCVRVHGVRRLFSVFLKHSEKR